MLSIPNISIIATVLSKTLFFKFILSYNVWIEDFLPRNLSFIFLMIISHWRTIWKFEASSRLPSGKGPISETAAFFHFIYFSLDFERTIFSFLWLKVTKLYQKIFLRDFHKSFLK